MGWNKPSVASTPSPTPKKKPTALRGAVAGFIVVAVAAVVAFVLLSGGDAKPKAKAGKKPAAIKEVKPAVATNAVPMTNAAPKAEEETYLGRKVVKRVETTNETGRVKIVVTTDDGQTHRYYRTGQARRIFKHESDYALANLLSTPEGATPAPYPISPGLDEDFKASLMNPIVDEEDDTDEDRALKERVRQARLDAVDLMNQGFTFTQILTEHQTRARENSEVALSVAKEAKKILEEYGAEEASKYVRKMNEALGRMGIGPVKDIGASSPRGAQKEEKE